MLIKMMNRLKKEEKGFTLIELLAVIVILAVIAAIAVPYILGVIEKSKKNADVATFHQVYEAARLYVTTENIDVSSATGTTITVRGTLMAKNYLEKAITLPSNKQIIQVGKVIYKSGNVDSITLGTGTVTGTATASWTLAGASVIASTGETVPDATGSIYTTE
ncbi:prepilin-type N-terminal cleavage/methylation domain-containing protein [Paenibacillus qinlingensis]|uniref:Type IV pilus assembly protein PilA n=1 Tax=Paenibacillus qinlingensis TaxID=1837343 RepID=A0ABU1NQB6_9BACL|nr:prepilin-type N-terminal cleavage/methylation domain-containing protein [Paenibacillus qinlingensis]MDR6549672.1 type IV pilus assembly protein PilA [Paenibacillus qinlingensis]